MSESVDIGVRRADIAIQDLESTLATLERGLEVSDSTSTATTTNVGIQSKIKYKKLTPRRKDIIKDFLQEVYDTDSPTKYGSFGGDTWIEELITRFGRYPGRTGLVTPLDVRHWLSKAEFSHLYERARSRVFQTNPTPFSSESDFLPSALTSPSSSIGIGNYEKNIGREIENGRRRRKSSIFSSDFLEKTRFSAINQLYFQNYQSGGSSTSVQQQHRHEPSPSMASSTSTDNLPLPSVSLQPNGFVIRLPPMMTITPTTLFLKPTKWSAEFIPDSFHESLDTQVNVDVGDLNSGNLNDGSIINRNDFYLGADQSSQVYNFEPESTSHGNYSSGFFTQTDDIGKVTGLND